MNTNQNNMIKRVAILAGLFVGAFALAAVAATTWTPPPVAAPNGNVDAPINTGQSFPTYQIKAGRLRLNETSPDPIGLDVFGISRFFGNVEVGTTGSPATIKIVDGNQGVGKVLTSDASGKANWAVASGSTGSGRISFTTNSALIDLNDHDSGPSDFNSAKNIKPYLVNTSAIGIIGFITSDDSATHPCRNKGAAWEIYRYDSQTSGTKIAEIGIETNGAATPLDDQVVIPLKLDTVGGVNGSYFKYVTEDACHGTLRIVAEILP